jgi:aryl-alcohol dehydrogenase-like predicted oxidoreductase
MQTRKLGWTELDLTRIGLGTWAQGGAGWRYSWGHQEDRESIAAIHRALEVGINWVDTAAIYGLGHAEEVLGRALKALPRSRWPIVATKCGRVWDEEGNIRGRLTRESVREEAEASLRRLGVEVIDLYQVHWPDPDEEIEEGWGAIAELVREGKVRYAGVSNFSPAQIERARRIHPVASLQPPYSMLRREVEEELLGYCAANQVGVIVYSPMQKGLLTGGFDARRIRSLEEGDHRRNDPLFQEPALTPTLRLVERLRSLARDRNLTVAQLALAWVLRRPEVTAAIVGARRPGQIEETAAAGDVELDAETRRAIQGLLEEREAALGGKGG